SQPLTPGSRAMLARPLRKPEHRGPISSAPRCYRSAPRAHEPAHPASRVRALLQAPAAPESAVAELPLPNAAAAPRVPLGIALPARPSIEGPARPSRSPPRDAVVLHP